MPIPLKPFFMIRHGQTEANAAEIMAGSLDSPLTAKGRDQAKAARDVVAHLEVKPVAVFHSHLSRAKDTAHIINEAIGAPMFEDPDLAEIHAGEWEGEKYDACRHFLDDWAQAPGGETPDQFFERVKRGKAKALAKFNEPILIVCHGGVMRAFGELYGIRVPGRFENAHLYEYKPTGPADDRLANSSQLSSFPWEVYDYRLCSETRTLLRNESDIYSASISAAAMASKILKA
jgi:broad specificity phosphatase PhoE